MDSFVSFSQNVSWEKGGPLDLIVNHWIHHVGVREGQKDQAKISTTNELLLCDQSVILESS